MTQIINNNSDLLFLYEAINCNPNGDPDQENKPRMDYDTKTNLVTDVRVKRFLRDYLKSKGMDIFVDMEGDSKVSPDTRLVNVINQLLSDEEEKNNFFDTNPDMEEMFDSIVSEKKASVTIMDTLREKKNTRLNHFILSKLVHDKFVDIRMFGSAFAIGGFTKSFTGAIQLNWGYSLNKVELIDTNSIVTIMDDGNSTFGKDYRLHYSLLAFNGTINMHAAKSTYLSEEDRTLFRNSLWNSISALPTRSKLNQYPKLYVELVYADNIYNGYFGDLRNYIEVTPRKDIEEKQIRNFKDMVFNTEKLQRLIKEHKGKEIIDVIIKKSPDVEFPDTF